MEKSEIMDYVELYNSFDEFVGKCRKKEFDSPFVGEWLIETARRIASSMGLGKDSDYEDFVQAGLVRMFRKLPDLDFSKDNPQIFQYLRLACSWGIKDELKKRQRFLKKKELFMYTLPIH